MFANLFATIDHKAGGRQQLEEAAAGATIIPFPLLHISMDCCKYHKYVFQEFENPTGKFISIRRWQLETSGWIAFAKNKTNV